MIYNFLGGLEAFKGRVTQATEVIKHLDLITDNRIEELIKLKPHCECARFTCWF